ncbi:MAG: hypothetical protein ABH896_03175 [Candidatus Jacksonbacteria bacterium]
MKKCAICQVPLEGLMAKISGLFGCKPSTKKQGVCNKCEDKEETKTSSENPNQTTQPE